MKKCFCLLLLLSCIFSMAFAEVDLSGLSFQELLEVQQQVNEALWSSDGWQEVSVPPGVYQVGTEIPAGKWTISRAIDDYMYFRVGKDFQEGEVTGYCYTTDLEEPMSLILEDGLYVEIQYHSAVFTPAVLSFSFK